MCATTTLSAGEHSTFGGATDERSRRKQLFQDPSPDAGQRVIVIDLRLTLTAPLGVWLSTAMRAVDHCVETVCSVSPVPEATEAALKGIRQLVPARKMLTISMRVSRQSMKGAVLYNVKLGASHGIGHQLGPLGVRHAETTCVLLPAVLKYNVRVNGAQQKLVLDALRAEPVVADVLQNGYSLEKGIADLGDAIDTIIRARGLPRVRSHYGIGRDKLHGIAAAGLADWMCRTNPVPLETKEQVWDILEQCLWLDSTDLRFISRLK
ncbi:fe-containing alcohol [Ophiostoma piceae UAMH 11346]|uniref:Fe-containing alcohol n=1 Tax=Ophiostoma piceae (strain UAMH 11346) TaxID=1262450 RepID=S3CCQ7_OPHP1|nr:fe-containing alcohol [Ophiostoma piceae UAMH 11346]